MGSRMSHCSRITSTSPLSSFLVSSAKVCPSSKQSSQVRFENHTSLTKCSSILLSRLYGTTDRFIDRPSYDSSLPESSALSASEAACSLGGIDCDGRAGASD